MIFEPPKSIDDIIDILFKPITPHKILTEWEDDHILCGSAGFSVDERYYCLDLNYCGARNLGAFEFADSAKARAVATDAIRNQLYILMGNWDYPEVQFSEQEIRDAFLQGDIPFKIYLGRGYSRAHKSHLFEKLGQEAFERIFGPLQPWSWTYSSTPKGFALAGKTEHRWKTAQHLEITHEGTYWSYYAKSGKSAAAGYVSGGYADNSKVQATVPVSVTRLHNLVRPAATPQEKQRSTVLACWPF